MQGGNFLSGALAGAFSSVSGDLLGHAVKNSGASSIIRSNGFAMLTGVVSGGVGSVIGGGNFWMGAGQGLVVTVFNHLMHREDVQPDTGYDKDGNRINKNGGDTTDYRYDDNGKIISSTSVEVIEGYSEFNTPNRDAYGKRWVRIGGGTLMDPSAGLMTDYISANTIFKGLGLAWNFGKAPIARNLGALIKNYAPSLNKGRYFRIGISKANNINSNKGTRKVFRATWGNKGKHWFNIDLGKW